MARRTRAVLTSSRLSHLAASALAVVVVVLGVRLGSKAAGGSDSYGYVSEADLWLKGELWVSQPWVEHVPWYNAPATFTPLGYRQSPGRWSATPPIPHPPRDRWSIVPTYAPGLPLLMAAAKGMAGHCAVFWVVPILAGVMILATFGIGVRLGSAVLGLAGAWLVATSPTFLQMALAPMSDVAASAAWAVAFWCLFGRAIASGVACGIAGGLAVLIRPNLAPLAVAMAIWVALAVARATSGDRRRAIWRAVATLAGIGAGAAAVAVINWVLYGAPWLSGYGTFEGQFRSVHAGPNLINYTTWFAGVHTPAALAGLLAIVVPVRRVWPDAPDRSAIVVMGAFALGLWVIYCYYQVFETSFYLRFLLPSWPFIMLGFAAAILAAANLSGRRRVAVTIVVLLLAALGFRGIRQADRVGAFTQRLGESRYVTAGKFVRLATPENSVVLSMQHSGSLRYYAGRMTLRYDSLGPSNLDQVVRWFAERGVHAYALLESWEVERFRGRFAGQAGLSRLDTPIFRHRGMTLYDLLPPPGGVAPETWEIPESAADTACRPPAPVPTLEFRLR